MAPKKADQEPQGAARFGRVKNNLKMGIVGLPNVGKSSLFNLLTEQVMCVWHIKRHMVVLLAGSNNDQSSVFAAAAAAADS